MPKIRLIIPSFRDSARLAVFLPELCRELEVITDARVQVVDDGSGPVESAAVQSLVARIAKSHGLLLDVLLLKRNLGKGGAVYAGWDVASDDVQWIGFVDADGATPASEVVRLVRLALEESPQVDAVIGSRVQMLGRTVERKVSRHIPGRIFATAAWLLTGLEVYDSQCGCKLLKSDFYRRVRPFLSEMRFAFDIDLLAHLVRAGAKIRECPVDWSDVPGSKVSVLGDGLEMFFALLRVRRRLAGTNLPPGGVS
jgi:dolichyl-phosphate beta-glucosyltransferase